jgi:hypothetical protein
LSASAFIQRCKTLAVRFGESVGLATGELAFAPEISSTAALMTLAGRASEMIARNRGRTHRVVPLCPVTDDVLVWTGYRECWRKQGAEQNFRFVEGGFTLHIGRQGEVSKPQILRSEWIGRRSGAFINQAGHPHWQLDVLESARVDVPKAPARFDDPATPRTALEFSSEPAPVVDDNLLLGLTVERMHLASAALWWRVPSVPVAHLPETVGDLDRWILGCVAYLRQEAARCAIVATPA